MFLAFGHQVEDVDGTGGNAREWSPFPDETL